MKNLLFLTSFLLCFSTLHATTDSIEHNSSINPIKKVTKNPKSFKASNCFVLCNPYKINTFCNLIQRGNYKAVKKSIENGVDINKVSIKLTPLMYAARHNRVEIIKLLIKNNVHLKTRDKNGNSALKWAKLSNATEAYNIILTALKNQKK